MKSVKDIYGDMEKAAFVGAALRGIGTGLKAGAKYIFGMPGRAASNMAGYTGKSLSRGFNNVSQAMAKEGLMGKVGIGASGLATLGMVPGISVSKGIQATPIVAEVDKALGGVPSLFLDPRGHGENYYAKARDTINNLNFNRMNYVKTAEDHMYNHRQIIKQADAGSVAKDALKYTLAGIGIGAGAPLALYGIGKGIKYTNQRTFNRDYRAVTKEDPSLDSEKAKKLYKVLHNTAPQVAREPLVASKVLRNMMEIPQITPQTFADVLKLEQLYQQTDMPYLKGTHQMKPSDIV